MNKGVHLLLVMVLIAPFSQAQTRLSLYEEFTSENCFTCGAVNPTVQALAASNSSNVVLITYPSPIPVTGLLYSIFPNSSAPRIAYYGIAATPQGRLNGTGLGTGTGFATPGHAGNLIQGDINTAAASGTPFDLTVSHIFNSTGDSIFINVTISTPYAYAAPSGASLKLRVANIEHLLYPTAAPGINGEQDFPNVVREMYPTPAGTSIASSWTAGQSTTISVSGSVQRFIDKNNLSVVAWIQNDANKSILQAGLSAIIPMTLDAGVTAARPPQGLICAAGPASVAHTAYLHNAGTSTLTTARIYYRSDAIGIPVSQYNWSGSLGPGATTVVTLPALTIAGGNHSITDSVQRPNGTSDINAGNNVATGRVNVYNTTQQNLPIATGFEGLTSGTVPAGWVLYDVDSNGRSWTVTKNIFGGPAGFGGSTYFLLHNNYYVPKGETNYAILPAAKLPTGTKSLQFSYAHAQFVAENDALDVVYSTDCGANWTSVWNAAGATLSTAPATMSYFIPAASQWTTVTVDITPVPQNAMIAFRGISDYGNSLYVDNIVLSAPAGVGGDVLQHASLHIVPNPVRDRSFADFYLSKSGDVRVVVTDATGRTVREISSPGLKAGGQHVAIPAEGLSGGIYSVHVSAEGSNSSVARMVVE